MTIIPFPLKVSVEDRGAAAVSPPHVMDLGGRFPWVEAGEDHDSAKYLICNLALGDIRNTLRAMLTMEGRVHVETYLAATGLLAGFAAQRALLDRLSRLPAERRAGQVVVATTRAGDKFYFGDMLNDALIARREEEKRLKIWPLAFDAAISAGMKQVSVPRLETLFGDVAGRISEPFFPSADTKPAASAKPLLTLFWPLARQTFDGRLTAQTLPGEQPKIVPHHWRPVILAFVAADCLLEAAKTMPPAKALSILMQSAIYGSKVDPSGVEGGRATPTA